MDFYQNKIASELRNARVAAWAIDSALLYYFFFAVYFLYFVVTGATNPSSELSPTFLLYLFPFSMLLAWLWSSFSNSVGTKILNFTHPYLKAQKNQEITSQQRSNWLFSFSGIFCALLFILTVFLGVSLTDMSFYALFSREGVMGAQRIFAALLSPNLEILGLVLAAMLETIFIAFMATFLAIPVAFIGSFFCARNLMKGSSTAKGVYSFLRTVFNFTRSVEPIIWAIVFSVWVGIGPFAGMLALMFHSVASLAKLYSEQIENIDKGPVEAIEATGANRVQVVWNAVVPQIVLPYLSFTIYRWDINIRMATIIGLVGGGGVGTLLMQYQGLARWNEVGTIVIVIALVVWVMDYLSARIREAIS